MKLPTLFLSTKCYKGFYRNLAFLYKLQNEFVNICKKACYNFASDYIESVDQVDKKNHKKIVTMYDDRSW